MAQIFKDLLGQVDFFLGALLGYSYRGEKGSSRMNLGVGAFGMG